MIPNNKINFLLHKCRIERHPISFLPAHLQEQYICALFYLVQKYGMDELNINKSFLKILLQQWCESITGQKVSNLLVFKESVYKALSLHRIGWKFFRMKRDLFFDFFYLIWASGIYLSSDNFEFLYKSVDKDFVNIFTRGALKDVYRFFNPLIGKQPTSESKLPSVQLHHYKFNVDVRDLSLKKILVVANVSAGKSTLINAIVGSAINEVKTTACTNKLCHIFCKPISGFGGDGMTFLDKSDNSKFMYSVSDVHSNDFDYAATCFFSMLGNRKICIIDSPGINNAEDLSHGKVTAKAIDENDYNLILYVSNCQYFGTDDEKTILTKLIKKSKSPIVFCLNQLDKFKQKEDSIEKMISDFTSDLKKLGINNPLVVPISAEASLLAKLDFLGHDSLDEDDLFELEQYQKRFSKDYYNLPEYSNLPKNYDFERTDSNLSLLDKTGMWLLEQTILQQLYKY